MTEDIFIDRSIRELLENEAKEVIFELNNENTRNYFKNIIETKLKFRGLTNFKVVCDETNNHPAIIDKDQFACDVYIGAPEYRRYNLFTERDDFITSLEMSEAFLECKFMGVN